MFKKQKVKDYLLETIFKACTDNDSMDFSIDNRKGMVIEIMYDKLNIPLSCGEIESKKFYNTLMDFGLVSPNTYLRVYNYLDDIYNNKNSDKYRESGGCSIEVNPLFKSCLNELEKDGYISKTEKREKNYTRVKYLLTRKGKIKICNKISFYEDSIINCKIDASISLGIIATYSVFFLAFFK